MDWFLDLEQYNHIIKYRINFPQVSTTTETFEAKTSRIEANVIDIWLKSRFNENKDTINYNLIPYQAYLVVEQDGRAIPNSNLVCYLRYIETINMTKNDIDELLVTGQMENL